MSSKRQSLHEIRYTLTFEKLCRSTNVNYMQEFGSNQQEDDEKDSVDTEDKNYPVAYAELMSSNGW